MPFLILFGLGMLMAVPRSASASPSNDEPFVKFDPKVEPVMQELLLRMLRNRADVEAWPGMADGWEAQGAQQTAATLRRWYYRATGKLPVPALSSELGVPEPEWNALSAMLRGRSNPAEWPRIAADLKARGFNAAAETVQRWNAYVSGLPWFEDHTAT